MKGCLPDQNDARARDDLHLRQHTPSRSCGDDAPGCLPAPWWKLPPPGEMPLAAFQKALGAICERELCQLTQRRMRVELLQSSSP